ncbi:17721_t:CDS:1, partial [Gigaspora margarita]
PNATTLRSFKAFSDISIETWKTLSNTVAKYHNLSIFISIIPRAD